MARIPLSVIFAFVVPVVLLVVNLVFNLGGILVLMLLIVWVGLGVFFITPEEKSAD